MFGGEQGRLAAMEEQDGKLSHSRIGLRETEPVFHKQKPLKTGQMLAASEEHVAMIVFTFKLDFLV